MCEGTKELTNAVARICQTSYIICVSKHPESNDEYSVSWFSVAADAAMLASTRSSAAIADYPNSPVAEVDHLDAAAVVADAAAVAA